MESNCPHYISKCDIKSPCCQEFFPCRICHDIKKNEEERDLNKRHTIDRNKIPAVRCRDCQTEQVPEKSCVSCGIEFASYFCKICRLYDSKTNQELFHCEGCNCCYIGQKEQFFHCDGCSLCFFSSGAREYHICKPNPLKQECPVCLEDLSNSREDIMQLICGHYIHCNCSVMMIKSLCFKCPICSEHVFMSKDVVDQTDRLIEEHPMPPNVRDVTVEIICNDCCGISTVKFHGFGLKCQICGLYNTKKIS